MAVLIETSLGDIVVDLYTEERPKCSINFLKLCKLKYYNYSLFHTVQRSFLAQAGDPTGTGAGGESVWGVLKGEQYRYFEMEAIPRLKHLKMGTLSMVNNGSGTHGSQFLLTLGESVDYLDSVHTVFGEVAEGEDVLMKINEAYCDQDGRPYQDIRIYHTVVLEDPFDDPEGFKLPERSPSPPMVIADSNRIGAEEDIDDYKGLSEDQIKQLITDRESKANAQILEMVGDIPDADAKPPENVLFVCKLNPVTTSEDLEIIFSRFGAIISCEVICDQKSGDSLQYAFIEFENEDDCEKAYFKMDNVLIDDRRIHVDFSQSLAKVKGLHKRKMSQMEEPDCTTPNDGLVATKREKPSGEKYKMVVDDESEGGEKRRDKGKEDRSHRSERGHRHQRGREEKSSRRHRSRSRSRDRSSKHSQHKHRRSRSRSRDRHYRSKR
ncbi:peptidyl-prolyl cis-trans isomerase-like 4 [Halichondria panicea]|uniref:peptidyl-prolyl cis-trans isomerase-like 4 n=1 Tax=Halichondria panicea TaxID=6063 RepID=UPI00312B5E38